MSPKAAGKTTAPVGAATHRARTRTALAAALLLVFAACATPPRDEAGSRPWPEQLADVERAAKAAGGDPERRMAYYRQREQAIGRALAAAAVDLDAGRFDEAAAAYREVLAVDRQHERAAAGLAAVDAARARRGHLDEARRALGRGDLARAEALLKPLAAETPENPELRALDRQRRAAERRAGADVAAADPRLDQPVSLDFREAPLKLVLEAVSRATGIPFVFDRDVKPDLRGTVVVRDLRAAEAIDLLLGANQLARRTMAGNAVFIYPNTPQKVQENQELVLRAFHVGNADPKQTANLLRGVLKVRDVFIDERTNLLVMRDTPDAVRLAERLVAMQDQPEPEVLLELEILEVSRTKVRELGVNYPGVFSGPPNAVIGPVGTLANIGQLARDEVTVDRGFALRLLRTDSDTKTLANPRVRVRNKEKARVHVGERVPVVSSSLVGNGQGEPIRAEQIQYLDTGIKVDAEPTVHADDTVAVRLNLDVSSLGAKTTTPNGSIFYPVETRNVSTALRLRDGETQALMGLIRDNDSQGSAGLPGLGELPLLNYLFGSNTSERAKRELVLLITPRIVRGVSTAELDGDVYSGTEAQLRARPPQRAATPATPTTPAR